MRIGVRERFLVVMLALGGLLLAPPRAGIAQQGRATPIPETNTCKVDPDGTVHVTRVVPVPETLSPQARRFLTRLELLTPSGSGPGPTLAERRAHTDAFRVHRAAEAMKLYPVKVTHQTIGGVRCDLIDPLNMEKRDRLLINVHGGGFVTDSGSLVEGIPIAYLTRTRVVSVYYRLAPEHPFPAAVEDTVAVYKELLKSHKAKDMALFGTSAGAILTGEVAVEMRKEGLPLPAALGIFSGLGDFSIRGDSQNIYTLQGFAGTLALPSKGSHDAYYAGSTNPKDPVLSPVYADLTGFPPTLFISSTRDMLLSGTTTLDRAFLRAGVETQLVVFDGLPHAFWYDYELPESKEALGIMAKFFDEHVGR